MMVTLKSWIAILAAAGSLGALPAVSSPLPASPPHFDLDRSTPAADSTVAPTSEVRLWFTQAPQDHTTQIRLMAGEERVPTSDVTVDPDDATSAFVTLESPLSVGEYRVLWRSMAQDGHVVTGEFGFSVAAAPITRGAALAARGPSR